MRGCRDMDARFAGDPGPSLEVFTGDAGFGDTLAGLLDRGELLVDAVDRCIEFDRSKLDELGVRWCPSPGLDTGTLPCAMLASLRVQSSVHALGSHSPSAPWVPSRVPPSPG